MDRDRERETDRQRQRQNKKGKGDETVLRLSSGTDRTIFKGPRTLRFVE